MPVNESLLAAHRSYRDEAEGIEEEFIQPRIGSGSTVAVVSRPLGERRSTGWVVCPPFAMEQVHLGHLEVRGARALAREGFVVLRFHGQGYGDSEGDPIEVGLAQSIREVSDALDLLAEREGLERFGLLGARYGGMVAALLAEARRLPLLALWEPVVSGRQFMRDFIRSQLFMDLAEGARDAAGSDPDRVRGMLEREGVADVKGFPLTKRAHDEIGGVDLIRDLRTFGGSSLVLGVSRTERMTRGVARLAEHLHSLGGRCRDEVIQDQFAGHFGQYHYYVLGQELMKSDTLWDVTAALADRTADWAAQEDDLQSEGSAGS